jgi:hypothetical protein
MNVGLSYKTPTDFVGMRNGKLTLITILDNQIVLSLRPFIIRHTALPFLDNLHHYFNFRLPHCQFNAL